MYRVEALLVVAGVLLLAVAAVLLVAHGNLAECIDLVDDACQAHGFAYEGGGKLALLLGFVLFLLAALHGLFSGSGNRNRWRSFPWLSRSCAARHPGTPGICAGWRYGRR